MVNREQTEEKHLITTSKTQEAMPLIYSPSTNFDVIAYSLSSTQHEILAILLATGEPISAKGD